MSATSVSASGSCAAAAPSATPGTPSSSPATRTGPYTLDYLDRICDDFLELHGDRAEGDDPAIVAGHRVVPRASRWPSSATRRAAT